MLTIKRLLTFVAPITLVLSACGSDSDSSGSNSASQDSSSDSADAAIEESASDSASSASELEASASEAEAAEPDVTESATVTIEHRYGVTTFDTPPKRIVSIDQQWTDVLIALDTPPDATVKILGIEEGLYPWQQAGIGDDVELLSMADKVPYEAIAALKPDLIVITYYASDQATYDLLNEIAPTIGPLGDEQVDSWESIATAAGEVLNLADAADELMNEATERSAALLEELPGLEGLDYILASYVPSGSIYVVADPDDGASQLFAQLGMHIDPDLLEIADGGSGRVTLSHEEIGLLDADLLIMLTNGVDTADIPGYDLLPAVATGAVAILDVPTVTGLNTPSPLSVPYALGAIEPALRAAAAASDASN